MNSVKPPGTVISLLIPQLDVNMEHLLAGMRAHARHHQLDWDIRITGLESIASIAPQSWVVTSKRDLLTIDACPARKPIVVPTGRATAGVLPCARYDNAVFGRLAALHLFECGYQHVGYRITNYHERHQQRLHGFIKECKRLKLNMHAFPTTLPNDPDNTKQVFNTLPKPMGIYAPVDSNARWLRSTLLDHGFKIPDEFGIIGTGNIRSDCLQREPELSTVSMPWRLLGRAAGLMIQRLESGVARPEPMLIKPTHIIQRASTQRTNSTDPFLAKAITWLKRNLDHPRPLQGLLSFLDISRPTLAKRFRHGFNATPKQIHERLCLQRARSLLADPAFSIAEVAQMSGYSSNAAFSAAFKRYHGLSPQTWRSSILP